MFWYSVSVNRPETRMMLPNLGTPVRNTLVVPSICSLPLQEITRLNWKRSGRYGGGRGIQYYL